MSRDLGIRRPAAAAETAHADEDGALSTREARAPKLARDAAWGWAKAMSQADRRVGEWVEAVEHARQSGTDPTVLRDYIREAADRAGLDEAAVPVEVWHAAGGDQNR